jgi:inorganic pyrophosphatase
MNNVYSELEPWARAHRLVNVVVETPMGSRFKFKLDEASGLFKISHALPAGSSLPYDFGFIPGTRAEDGDPLDVMIVPRRPPSSAAFSK